MIDSSHFPDLRRALPVIGAALAVWIGVLLLPPQEIFAGLASYLPLHLGLETLTVVVGCLIAAIGLQLPMEQSSRNLVLLTHVFLGVAILDFFHAFAFEGMPGFGGRANTATAIWFWLAARGLATLGVLLAVILPWTTPARRRHTLIFGGAVLGYVAAVSVIVLTWPESLPTVFIRGQGLTPFKNNVEYVLILTALVTAALCVRQMKAPRSFDAAGLMGAAVLSALGEFLLTRYTSVSDHLNVAGHVFKVAGYYFLYRALVIDTIRRPYEALAESRNRLQATLRALPDLLFEMDEHGRYIAVHAAMPGQLAAHEDLLVGKRLEDFFQEPALSICRAALRDAKETGSSYGRQVLLDVPDGRLWFELAVARKPTPPGEPARFMVTSRDVTQRMRQEAHLRQEARIKGALLALADDRAPGSPEDQLRFAMREAREVTGSAVACFGLVAADGRSLSPVVFARAGDEADESLGGHALALDDGGVWAGAVDTGQPSLLDGPDKVPAETGLPETLGPVTRWVAVPVMEGGKLRLLAGLGNKPAPYTEADIAALRLLATGLWRQLHSAQMERDMRNLSAAVAQSPHPIMITDAQARLEYVNDAFVEASGYEREEVLGRNPSMLQSGRTPAHTYRDMWSRLSHGEPWQGELINRRKDGRDYVDRTLIYPVRDAEGNTTHYLSHQMDVSAQRAALEKISQLSNYDQLTGLPNIALLEARVADRLAGPAAGRQPHALIWMNLDNFRAVNDSLGRAHADLVLCEVARRLQGAVMNREAILARRSADDFLLFVAGVRHEGAAAIADMLLRVLRQPVRIEAEEIALTASVGIALWPEDGQGFEVLAHSAESAMFRAKFEGRNAHRFHSAEAQVHAARSLAIVHGLRFGIDREEFRLVYQPKYALADGGVVGMEALLRWRHPRLGEVSPGEFIPIAESTGFIGELGEWVVGEALRQIAAWQGRGLRVPSVAVNVSVAQFSQPEFPGTLARMAAGAGVDPALLELELTEATAMKNPEIAVHTLAALSSLGFRVAIDDFGTGYSSLNYLRRLGAKTLKIDRSFVADIEQDGESRVIVSAIIGLAHRLGLTAIAEGVETAGQVEILRGQGCDEAQGFFFSRPLEVKDVEALLAGRPAATAA